MRSPEDSSDDASVAYSYNFPGIEKMRMHSAEPICSLLGVWRLILFVEILQIDDLQKNVSSLFTSTSFTKIIIFSPN